MAPAGTYVPTVPDAAYYNPPDYYQPDYYYPDYWYPPAAFSFGRGAATITEAAGVAAPMVEADTVAAVDTVADTAELTSVWTGVNTPWRMRRHPPYSCSMAHSTFSRNKIKHAPSALRPTVTADSNRNADEPLPSPGEVATRAYFNYLNQGSLPGHDVRHWLEAEAQLLAESRFNSSPRPQTHYHPVCNTGTKSASSSENHCADGRQTMHDTQKLFRICGLL